MPDPKRLMGQVLHGQFRVDAVVSDDTRSSSFQGYHLLLNVPVVVRVPKLPHNPELAIKRFRFMTRLHYRISQMTHGAVRVLAAGTAPMGPSLVPFAVLEWLDGRTLARVLSERRGARQPGYTFAAALEIMAPAVEALAMCHANGITHREISPHSFIVTESPSGPIAKVFDFGNAKIAATTFDISPLSQTLQLPVAEESVYVAPEQLSQSLGPVGPATDVFSLALLLLEMFSGRAIVSAAGGTDTLLNPVKRPTPRNLGLTCNSQTEAVFERALAIKPADRYGSIGELWGELQNALGAPLAQTLRSTAKQGGEVTNPSADHEHAAALARQAEAEPLSETGEMFDLEVAFDPNSSDTAPTLFFSGGSRSVHEVSTRRAADLTPGDIRPSARPNKEDTITRTQQSPMPVTRSAPPAPTSAPSASGEATLASHPDPMFQPLAPTDTTLAAGDRIVAPPISSPTSSSKRAGSLSPASAKRPPSPVLAESTERGSVQRERERQARRSTLLLMLAVAAGSLLVGFVVAVLFMRK